MKPDDAQNGAVERSSQCPLCERMQHSAASPHSTLAQRRVRRAVVALRVAVCAIAGLLSRSNGSRPRRLPTSRVSSSLRLEPATAASKRHRAERRTVLFNRADLCPRTCSVRREGSCAQCQPIELEGRRDRDAGRRMKQRRRVYEKLRSVCSVIKGRRWKAKRWEQRWEVRESLIG